MTTKNSVKKKIKVRKTDLRTSASSNFVTDLRPKRKSSSAVSGIVKGDNFLKASKSSLNYFLHNPTPEARSGRKSFVCFIIISVLLIITLKLLVYSGFINLEKEIKQDLGGVELLFSDISQSIQSGDISAVNQKLSLATEKFLSIEKDLANVDGLILSLSGASSNEKYRLFSQSRKFSKVALILTDLGKNLSSATSILMNDDEKSWDKKLSDFNDYSLLVENNLSDLEQTVARINVKRLPEEWQDEFLKMKSELFLWHQDFSRIFSISEELSDFFGYNKDRRYLLIFQNNTEMRASGGFIGSYALVDFRNGQIKNIEVPTGGSYDTEGAMRKLIKSPAPIQLVSARWYFWDANWFPDWPTTARNLMWFYENSGGSSVDGVISFTPTVFEDLLKITGPIDMQADYGMTISSDNFYELVQAEVEKKSTTTPEINTEPKKIIADLFSKTLEAIPNTLNKDSLVNFISLFENDWYSKQILVYLKDESWQKKIADFAIAGRQELNPDGDYLMVVNSNIAGQKTDRVIKQSISLKSSITIDNEIVDSLTISRQHNGIKGQEFSGVRNVNWLRVYVPKGSRLLAANGFSEPEAKYFEAPDESWENSPFMSLGEVNAKKDLATGLLVYDENNYTVFSGWTMVDPGQNAIINIDYKLPKTFTNNYSLLVQKQAGDLNTDFNFNFLGVDELGLPSRAYPKNLNNNSDLKFNFNRDLYFYYLWLLKHNSSK